MSWNNHSVRTECDLCAGHNTSVMCHVSSILVLLLVNSILVLPAVFGKQHSETKTNNSKW